MTEILRMTIFWAVMIFSVCLIIFATIMLLQNFFGIPPYMPSFNKNIKKVLEELRSKNENPKKSKNPKPLKLIDLGSGDGKIVFLAARLGYQATGVEINPFLVLVSKLRALLWKNPPKFELGSYHDVDFSQYDVIFTYLFPHTMHVLEEKIFAQLKDGAVVVSNTFSFKNHKPFKEIGKVKVYRKA